MEGQMYPRRFKLDLVRGGMLLQSHGARFWPPKHEPPFTNPANPLEKTQTGPGSTPVLPDPDDSWENQ